MVEVLQVLVDVAAWVVRACVWAVTNALGLTAAAVLLAAVAGGGFTFLRWRATRRALQQRTKIEAAGDDQYPGTRLEEFVRQFADERRRLLDSPGRARRILLESTGDGGVRFSYDVPEDVAPALRALGPRVQLRDIDDEEHEPIAGASASVLEHGLLDAPLPDDDGDERGDVVDPVLEGFAGLVEPGDDGREYVFDSDQQQFVAVEDL